MHLLHEISRIGAYPEKPALMPEKGGDQSCKRPEREVSGWLRISVIGL
jgi:hypothetical protein